jgi:hypothetical protein
MSASLLAEQELLAQEEEEDVSAEMNEETGSVETGKGKRKKKANGKKKAATTAATPPPVFGRSNEKLGSRADMKAEKMADFKLKFDALTAPTWMEESIRKGLAVQKGAPNGDELAFSGYAGPAEAALAEAVRRNDIKGAAAACEQGAEAWAVMDDTGSTPLTTAALAGNLEVAKWLVEKGADPFACSSGLAEGATALHSAVMGGYPLMIAWLVDEMKLDVHAVTIQGLTPLHCAAAAGKVNSMECLLARGADLAALDRSGHTPFHAVMSEGRVPAAEYLARQIKDGVTLVACVSHLCYHHDTKPIYTRLTKLKQEVEFKSRELDLYSQAERQLSTEEMHAASQAARRAVDWLLKRLPADKAYQNCDTSLKAHEQRMSDKALALLLGEEDGGDGGQAGAKNTKKKNKKKKNKKKKKKEQDSVVGAAADTSSASSMLFNSHDAVVQEREKHLEKFQAWEKEQHRVLVDEEAAAKAIETAASAIEEAAASADVGVELPLAELAIESDLDSLYGS